MCSYQCCSQDCNVQDQDQDQDYEVQDQDQDQDFGVQDQDQDQDSNMWVSRRLKTKTSVSRPQPC